jgi:threonyl-tRNA synthetase
MGRRGRRRRTSRRTSRSLEEAERRDHRKLGSDLDLFSFPEEIGSGLAVFHPRGGLIRMIMEDYSRPRHVEDGLPLRQLAAHHQARTLRRQRHLDWYADGIFPPMELDGGTEYYLKPMNCPFHILIYRSRTRSYRELRCGCSSSAPVYRYEKSGVVHGLTRVRGMTQDDATHLHDAGADGTGAASRCCTFTLSLLRDYGLDDFYLELSTKPEAEVGRSDEDWEEATEALRQAAMAMNLELVMDPGGGAFYGPKISVRRAMRSGARGRCRRSSSTSSCRSASTSTTRAPDGKRHQPVMIHRALFGSVERFFAVLTEHYAGAFPLWLSPEQLWLLPVADRNAAAAHDLAATARAPGSASRSTTRSSRSARRSAPRSCCKAPYVTVVGDRDLEAGRSRCGPRRSRRSPACRSTHRAGAARGGPHRALSSRCRRADPMDRLWSPWRMDYIEANKKSAGPALRLLRPARRHRPTRTDPRA